MSLATNWLVTGASRGLGLEYVKQISKAGNTVFATCRNPTTASALKQIAEEQPGKVHIVALDVTKEETIKEAAKIVGGILGEEPLDYLMNNAATQATKGDTGMTLEWEAFSSVMLSNVMGPAWTLQHFMPYLERSKKPTVLNMSSGMGSISLGLGARLTSYSVSKTAINMLNYKFSQEKPNVIFLAVDPGWVKTDMGGSGAVLEIPFSCEKVLSVLTNATLADSGTFVRYDGVKLPW